MAYEIYFIQETSKMCDCKLICTDCLICIHNFTCSCIDSSIKYNICKHIHLLTKWRKENPEYGTEDVYINDQGMF